MSRGLGVLPRDTGAPTNVPLTTGIAVAGLSVVTAASSPGTFSSTAGILACTPEAVALLPEAGGVAAAPTQPHAGCEAK